MKRFISHVQLPVRDLDQSINWYVKYLQCKFIANFGEFAIIEFNEGTSINLWKTNDITSSTFLVNGYPFPTIGIEVDDIDELVKGIIESGVNFEGINKSFEDEEGRKFFRFFDLNGNMLVAHEEPKR